MSDSLSSLFPASAVKSVQRDTANTTSAVDVTITEVNMNKAIVIANGHGSPSSTSNTTGFTAVLTSPTNLRITRDGFSGTVTVAWQVIEFH